MTPEKILAAVAKATGTTVARIRDVRRDDHAVCRYIAFGIIRGRCPDMKLGDIALACGYSNPTTTAVRAQRYLTSRRFQKEGGRAAQTLACALLDGEVQADAVAAVARKLWQAPRVYFPPELKPQPVRRMPGSPPGWLMTQKAVAGLYGGRSYRASGAQPERLSA